MTKPEEPRTERSGKDRRKPLDCPGHEAIARKVWRQDGMWAVVMLLMGIGIWMIHGELKEIKSAQISTLKYVAGHIPESTEGFRRIEALELIDDAVVTQIQELNIHMNNIDYRLENAEKRLNKIEKQLFP